MSAVRKLKTQTHTDPVVNPADDVAMESRRILVVEDEVGIVQAYKDILEPTTNVIPILKSSRSAVKEPPAGTKHTSNQLPFEVVSVSNGEDAIAAVEKSLKERKPFAMGFFDVLLGTGIDGIETVKQIHSLDPRMYAVLVTAYQDRHVDTIQKIFGDDFQDGWDYLNKPFSQGEILQKARNMTAMWNVRRHDEAQQVYMNHLKRQLSEGEKMTSVAAIARSVGHEFGNILLQIMGRADLSKDGKEMEMKQALETILVATEHASKILDRFKNLSKPSESSIKFGSVHMDNVVKEVLLLMSHELKRLNIEVVVDINRLPEITASHSTLVQVFMNLIINATHAMGSDGKITITGKVKDENVEIRVHDSGPGIPEKNVEHVFTAFFTTKGEKGSGLGLYICKELIEINHNGRLTVNNHANGGAEFCIEIPIRREGGANE